MAGGQLPFGFAPQGELTSYTPTLRERAADWLRLKLFTDDREGQDKANYLVNLGETVIPPFGFATSMYDMGRAGGQGDYLTAGAIGAMAMAPVPGSKKGIRAYHGSPHSFDKFDMSKIGTGEGAQAYGHGLYFAENEGVARGYRDTLAPAPTAAQEAARRAIDQYGDASIAADEIAKMVNEGGLLPETVDHYKTIEAILRGKASASPGSMYEVSINADPNAFLDWDKPLSEQPEAVQKFFPKDVYGHKYDQINGSDAYESLIDQVARARTGKTSVSSLAPSDRTGAVEMLREAGVPGIRYLDAGSRGAGDGTRNYVVFDDKLISIVRKYGIAGASAMFGYNILDGLTEAQAEELKKAENN